ncbi:MAG: hypothetical protein RJA72_554 [Pseudomonadota bacterium]
MDGGNFEMQQSPKQRFCSSCRVDRDESQGKWVMTRGGVRRFICAHCMARRKAQLPAKPAEESVILTGTLEKDPPDSEPKQGDASSTQAAKPAP